LEEIGPRERTLGMSLFTDYDVEKAVRRRRRRRRRKKNVSEARD
jgi:hypothetical protein